MPSLPIVVVLPTPLTPTKSQTVMPSGAMWRTGSPSRIATSSVRSASRRASGLSIPSLLTREPQVVEQLGGEGGADVSQDERLLEVVPGRGVDAALRADRREVAAKGGSGPGRGGRGTSGGPPTSGSSSTAGSGSTTGAGSTSTSASTSSAGAASTSGSISTGGAATSGGGALVRGGASIKMSVEGGPTRRRGDDETRRHQHDHRQRDQDDDQRQHGQSSLPAAIGGP